MKQLSYLQIAAKDECFNFVSINLKFHFWSIFKQIPLLYFILEYKIKFHTAQRVRALS